jgi:single-stranded DNA-binding protein
MNRFMGSGTLPRAAKVNGGEKKVVKFTLAACYGRNAQTQRDLISYVPCVVFEPAPEIEKLLAQDWKGTFFEVEGHVTTSKFEQNGETKYSTEVIVNRGGIRLVSQVAPYFSEAAAARDKEATEGKTE